MSHATTLPSVSSAEAFWRGEEGSFGKLILSTLGRGAVIAAGLYAAGERQKLVKYSLFAATAIEIMVLALVKQQLEEAEPAVQKPALLPPPRVLPRETFFPQAGV